MTTRRHGITEETVKNVLVDSGALYINYGVSGQKILGATRGGNSFTVTQEIKKIDVDGARGPMKGHRRIIDVVAQIKANMIELSTDMLKKALPGSISAGYPVAGPTMTHSKITRSLRIYAGLAGDGGVDNYITNVALVGEIVGTSNPIVCILKNVLADGNLEMTFIEKDEAVVALQFTGHFSPATPDTEPWEIRYPKVNVES